MAKIVVVELWLHDDDGFNLLQKLSALPGARRVLALTRRCDEVALHRAQECEKAGMLSGLVWKISVAPTQLRAALEALWTGEDFFPPEVCEEMRRQRAAPDFYAKTLSPTEQEMVPFLAIGWTDEAVSRRLGQQPCTIKRHRLSILGKLELRREELPGWALRKGFIQPDLPAAPCSFVD